MTSDNIRGSTSKDVREPADWPVWRCPERWMSSSVCVFGGGNGILGSMDTSSPDQSER